MLSAPWRALRPGICASGGGTAFADYVWKPVVLIEMKKCGEDLAKHYCQAFDYWIRLAPNRPKWVTLCNFDEFWVYDFDSAQIDVPLDTVRLDELPDRWGPLAFLFPTNEKPVFGNDHEAVTREAADKLAVCFNKLAIRKDVGRPLAQRFILQMLVALFAEDIGLMEKYFVTQLLGECKSPTDSFDLLGGLFTAMNTQGGTKGGRFCVHHEDRRPADRRAVSRGDGGGKLGDLPHRLKHLTAPDPSCGSGNNKQPIQSTR